MTDLLKTNLGDIPLLGRGKVRDLYAVGDALLLVATDRISAFDHVLGTGIPGKGKILTQISLFWFDLISDLVPNHLIATDVRDFPAVLQPYSDQLEGRSMLVKRAAMFPGGVCSARISRRIGLEGIPSCRNRVRHPVARRPQRRFAVTGTDFHARYQEPGTAPTTKIFRLPQPKKYWEPPMRRSCAV